MRCYYKKKKKRLMVRGGFSVHSRNKVREGE